MRPTSLVVVVVVAAASLSLSGCSKRHAARPAPGKDEAASPGLPTMGVDLAALDRSVEACDDFYQFACGGWIAATPIPPDRPGWFRSFSEIQERNVQMLRRILDDAAAGRLQSPYSEKLGDFWYSCMNEDEVPLASVQTLHEELAAIDSIGDRQHLAREVARLQLQGVNAFFRFGAQQDFRDASQMIAGADQGGLGLPDREYYLKQDERSKALRAAYLSHITRMFELAGVSPAKAKADALQVFQIETLLAEASMPRVERRDPFKVYNRIDREGLKEAAPSFDWSVFLETLGHPEIEAINVAVPPFFVGFDRLLRELPQAAIQSYLRWKLIDASASSLTEDFVRADFEFSSKLSGEEEILPRWKRCVSAVDGAMGKALGRPFVEETFGADGKVAAQALIAGIEEAFGASLGELEWMDERTREQAFAKLHTVRNKIGYPDRWRNYDDLEVGRTSYLENRFAAIRFDFKRDLRKIGKPVDPNEWYMSPPTVNAYYSALDNEMVFPAGILQSPFFSLHADEAANAGAIGMVMGHELTHGFDDQGRRFDADGNLRDWWSKEVSAAYEERAQCVVDQYDAYTILDGVHLNGRLTLGENIADIGGLQLAWDSFSKGREDLYVPDDSGFSPAQRFFLSYAQSWCGARRPDYARMLVTVDPHSPPEFRVNGAASNVPQFQEAFRCESGSPMAPLRRCEIW